MPTIADLLGQPLFRFECPACPERFETLSDKKRHVKDEHPRK